MNGKQQAQIIENTRVGEGLLRMRLRVPEIAAAAVPGQFVNLYVPDGRMILPRPLGIADTEGEEITVYYLVVGAGTEIFSALPAGALVDVLGPNGNGYDLPAAGSRPLLVAGGGGVPPLLFAAKRIKELDAGAYVTAALGFRDEAFLVDELSRHADKVYVISETDPGLSDPPGLTGNVVQLFSVLEMYEKHVEILSRVTGALSCGPFPMMQALSAYCAVKQIPLQVSMEARMGCGYGACVGCSIQTVSGRKKACADGPVFPASEVIWND
jgi:dihydroorotate dehydrogenase electron transfer subunit